MVAAAAVAPPRGVNEPMPSQGTARPPHKGADEETKPEREGEIDTERQRERERESENQVCVCDKPTAYKFYVFVSQSPAPH